jgi:hypothetical protein
LPQSGAKATVLIFKGVVQVFGNGIADEGAEFLKKNDVVLDKRFFVMILYIETKLRRKKCKP